MFKLDISLVIESGGDQLVTIMDCVERAYMAEHQLDQLIEMWNMLFENKRKQSNQARNRDNNQNRNPQGNQLQRQNQNNNNNKRKGNSQASKNTHQ